MIFFEISKLAHDINILLILHKINRNYDIIG